MTRAPGPPEELAAFLEWLKCETEDAWAAFDEPTLDDFKRRGVGGFDWRRGTKWLPGLVEVEIESIQQQWSLEFPFDYRLFLRVLNAPDRPQIGALFSGPARDDLVECDRPSFYDWQRDSNAIRKALTWPAEGLLFDLEHNELWLKSWGPQPRARERQRAKLAEILSMAPRLVPVMEHRYLVKAPSAAGYVVLSVWQGDIIVYGSALREYLLAEFAELLGEDREERYRNAVAGVTRSQIAGIPFWGELALRDEAM